jgi:predicted nucleic acid-binding protein
MYLLDTNVLSELIRKRPRPALLDRLRQHPPEAFFTSCICVMELRQGSSLRSDKESFWGRIDREILSRVTILGFGLPEALLAGDLLAHLSRRGEPISLEDTLIGITALAQGYLSSQATSATSSGSQIFAWKTGWRDGHRQVCGMGDVAKYVKLETGERGRLRLLIPPLARPSRGRSALSLAAPIPPREGTPPGDTTAGKGEVLKRRSELEIRMVIPRHADPRRRSPRMPPGAPCASRAVCGSWPPSSRAPS